MKQTLLIELLTEELPPRALEKLSSTFADEIFAGLKEQMLADEHSVRTAYATPRRLAVSISHVSAMQGDRIIERKGPAVSSGLDADGNPTKALQGFMRSANTTFEQLQRVSDGKAEYFVAKIEQKGKALEDCLGDIVALAVKKLPVPKLMRWGDSDYQFVRPVHALTVLHGKQIVMLELLGLSSGNVTRGHRFLSSEAITIHHANDYERVLENEGHVIASLAKRREMIAVKLDQQAEQLNAIWVGHNNIDLNQLLGLSNQDRSLLSTLLDEVTALVEWPEVYVGEFEAEYLEVPQECLILTMQQNQKYFPLLDQRGKLLNKFLIVSNMQVEDPSHIIGGNQRVVRPRLADARFFYNKDRQQTLESRLSGLDKVVYHNKLGSQGERSQRVIAIASAIGKLLGGDELSTQAKQAACLAKADLLTDMVGEFPELQGIMGRYYAQHDGIKDEIAFAIEDHYKPRFAGDELPRNMVGICVALADKLETLVGMFGIGEKPTGDKDPYALRRHALGVIRMLSEKNLPLDLDKLLHDCCNIMDMGLENVAGKQSINAGSAEFAPNLAPEISPVINEISQFFYDRLAGTLREQGYTAQEVDAVLALHPQRLADVSKRLSAVRAFMALPEAAALAAANKRVGNILKKAADDPALRQAQGKRIAVVESLLQEPAEQALHQALSQIAPKAEAAFTAGDYTASLQALAALRTPVDAFFDQVMVNADDEKLRANRLALLTQLHNAMNRVADISRLAN